MLNTSKSNNMERTIKCNNEQNYESINVYLTREKTPIAFKNKLDELMELGAFDSEEEAIKWIESTPFELELYYEKDYGLFGVESEPLDYCQDIVSPYSKTPLGYDDRVLLVHDDTTWLEGCKTEEVSLCDHHQISKTYSTMAKENIIQTIIEQIKINPDDIIDGKLICDVYDKNGDSIYYDGTELLQIEIENNELVVVGERSCFEPNELTESILEEIFNGLVWGRNTQYKNLKIKERTREVADEMKKRFDALIEKAFNTGAFDWDEAFRNGYTIPKAIVAAAAKTVMDECCNYDCEIVNERDNIYQFL